LDEQLDHPVLAWGESQGHPMLRLLLEDVEQELSGGRGAALELALARRHRLLEGFAQRVKAARHRDARERSGVDGRANAVGADV
jgi:hypothetical protein